jgi:probable HAF family extracellular repeat protein
MRSTTLDTILFSWPCDSPSRSGVRLAPLAAFLGILLAASGAHASSFGIVDGPYISRIMVSGDGSTLVWNDGSVALRQVGNGTPTSIGELPGNQGNTLARAINYDGTVVVGSSHSGWPNHEAFRWTESGGIVGLGDFGADNFSIANDVSADGSSVVGFAACGQNCFQGFYWTETAGTLEAIPSSREGWAIAEDLDIVFGATPNNAQAVRWEAGTVDSFLVSPTVQRIWAAGNGGTVAVGVGSIGGVSQAVRWRCDGAGCSSGLGTLEGLGGVGAFDVTPDGDLVVGAGSGIGAAMIWDGSGNAYNLNDYLVDVHGLDLQGCRLDQAWGISDSGRVIVGTGNCPGTGDDDAWVVHLDASPFSVPEPSTTLVLATTLLGLALQRRR